MLNKLQSVLTILGASFLGLLGISSCQVIPVQVQNAGAISDHYEHYYVVVTERETPVADHPISLQVEGMSPKEGRTDSAGLAIFEVNSPYYNRAGQLSAANGDQLMSKSITLNPRANPKATIHFELDPATAIEIAHEQTPTPVTTTLSTNMLTAVPQSAAADPAPAATAPPGQRPLLCHDRFNPPQYSWPLGETAVNGNVLLLEAAGGRLHQRVEQISGQGDHLLLPVQIPCPAVGDFRASVTLAFDAVSIDAPIGFSLIFRQVDGFNWYIARIEAHGHLTVYAFHEGELHLLLPRVATTAIKREPGALNTLAVSAVEERITVEINGQVISSFTDERIPGAGKLGLALDGRVGQAAGVSIAEVYIVELP